jgi:hypothetical protein
MNNLSEFLRDKLRAEWGENGEGQTNFSNPDWRKQFFSQLCDAEDGKTIGLLKAKHQSLFHHQIKKIIKEKGQNPRTFGMTNPNKKFSSTTGGMSGEISPKPKPTDKNLDATGQTQQSTNQQGGMIPAGQGGQPPNQPSNPEEPKINFSPKTSGLTIKMMFNLLRLKFPALEGLDDDEIEALGEAWNPIFNKYLAGVAGMWMTALFTTGMIVTSKVADAKKKDPNAFGKKKEGDKVVESAIDKDNEETIDESYQTDETKPDENSSDSGWLGGLGTKKADEGSKDG